MTISRRPIAGWWFVIGLGVLLVQPQLTHAINRFVDGACASSGNGSSLTCGTSGPFKTVAEGINATQPADTLNIRGAHGGFDGTYHEYLGLWGTSGDANAAKALTCSSGSPCVVQGCSAALCGADETPTISGLVRRTDWTDRGNGVWSRTMESRSEWTGGDAPPNNNNPNQILQDDAKTPLQYGTSTTPAEGHWFFDAGSNTVYVNPIGSGNPNSDTKLWVPDQRSVLIVDGQPSCPGGNCPTTSFVTFRRLNIEGARWNTVGLYGSTTPLQSLTFDTVTVRYAPRFGMQGGYLQNLSMSNILVEYIGRGLALDTGGAFAWRFAHLTNATITNITTRHAGNAGGSSLECPWCDSPWNSKPGSDNGNLSLGNGMDVKQSSNVTVHNHTCADATVFCFQFDCSHDVTLDGFNYSRSRYGIKIREFTPDAATGAVRNYNHIIRNGTLDNLGYNDGGAIMGEPMSALAAGQFGYQIYNNFISRSSFAAISVDSADRVSIWNNSIYQDRAALGYGGAAATPNDGIAVLNTVTNLEIRNNIIKDTSSSAINVSGASSGQNPTLTNDDLNDAAGRWTGTGACGGQPTAVRWGGTCFSSVGAFNGATGKEANGISGDPLLANTGASPPDLHIRSGSAAIGKAVALSAFNTDIDGQTRPSGASWDIGADQFASAPRTPPAAPLLLQVTPWN